MVGLQPGALCIDMSTIAPSDVQVLADKVSSCGAAFVDAPVSGSVALAEAGTLTIMAGGDAPDVERARPLFEAMGSKLYHVGPLGSGATIKLAVNSIIYGLSGALSEALVFAERAGITRELAYKVFANSAIAGAIRALSARGVRTAGERACRVSPRARPEGSPAGSRSR